MEPRKARVTHVTRRAAPVVASVVDAAGMVEAPDSATSEESIHPDAPTNEEGTPADAMQGQGSASIARVGYAPIVRVDAARREIELCATSEALDSYGTVFDYAASKDAFTRWIGNVREMHERRAVGSRVGVRCDDEQRKVYVRVRISHGAADTWEKVLDGTLRGASIGASNVVWERQTRRVAGRERLLNVATRYDLVELSLVDSPSNPDALGITIVRDAVPDAALLDDLAGASPCAEREAVGQDEATNAVVALPAVPAVAGLETAFSQPADDPAAPPEVRIARQAAAHGWAVVGASHRTGEAANRDGKLPAHETSGLKPSLVQANFYQPPLTGFGDLELAALSGDMDTRARGPFSTNAEGYPDAGVPARAEERPTSALGLPDGGNARERFHAAARGILMGCGCPLCEGALAALGETGTAHDGEMRALRDGGVGASGGRPSGASRESALARALATGLSASVAQIERVDENVRGLGGILQAAVSQIEGAAGDLRRRVETLETQPLLGGPAAFAFDKTLALAPGGVGGGAHSQPGAAEQRRALESLAGKLTDPQAQIAVAAELIRLQRGE